MQFVWDGEPIGDPVDELPAERRAEPGEHQRPGRGQRRTSGSFIARGRASSSRARCRGRSATRRRRGRPTASRPPSGAGDRLYPWETEIDVSGLAPGTYTFVAMTDDPSGGDEGTGPFTDTRTIIVR